MGRTVSQLWHEEAKKFVRSGQGRKFRLVKGELNVARCDGLSCDFRDGNEPVPCQWSLLSSLRECFQSVQQLRHLPRSRRCLFQNSV